MAIGRIPEPGTGIPESIIAAKGDLLTGTANDTPAVLTVGANGTTLVADSATATGLKWDTPASGGMTLISTTTVSSTSVTLGSIPQTYKSLYIIAKNITFASGANGFRVLPNNVNNLSDQSIVREGVVSGTQNGVIRLSGGGAEMNNSTNNAWALTINNYTATDSYKPFIFSGFCVNGSAVNRDIIGGGAFRSNTEITSLVFDIEGATFTGGTILFYGVN
jgi:hypothetical protein